MKKIFLTILAAISFVDTDGQITNEKMNIVYRGVDNPLSFGAFGYSCKSVTITADTGFLVKAKGAENCGSVIYSAPEHGSQVTFRIFAHTKHGKKIIRKSRFRIKDLPDPLADIGGRRNDTISIATLKVQVGLLARIIPGFDIQTNFRVDSFGYAIIRSGIVIESGTNAGAVFNAKIKARFDKIEDGDTILFYDIFCTGYDRKSRKLEPFEIKAIG